MNTLDPGGPGRASGPGQPQPDRDAPAEPGSTPVEVDARGLRCPLPVLRLAQAIAAHGAPGGPVLIRLLATDPAAETDVPAFCRIRGLTLLQRTAHPGQAAAAGYTAYLVRAPGPPGPPEPPGQPGQPGRGVGQAGGGADSADPSSSR